MQITKKEKKYKKIKTKFFIKYLSKNLFATL